MNIGIVSKPWLPVPSHAYGAIEKLVYYLSIQLSNNPSNQIYLFAPGDSSIPPAIKLQSLFSHGVGGEINHPCTEVVQAMHSCIQAKKYDLDILHAHSVDPLLALSPFIDTPIVFSFHTFSNSIIKMLSKYANKSIAYTFLSQSHKKNFPWIKKAHVVYPGIDPACFPFVGEKKDYIAYVGSINEHKGIIEAIIIAEKSRLKLKIGGKLHEEDRMFYEQEFLPRIKNNPWVDFLGEINERQRNEMVGKAKALLFPIKWDEPFGIVQLEALVVGTPVIAFNRGAVPEIIIDGHNGFIVENIQQAVTATKKLSSISPRLCREQVKSKFNVSHTTNQFEKIYKQTINNYAMNDKP